jgi:hypothetical protein
MKIKIEKGKEYIFDIVRKKYVRNLPEEWVRQNMVAYLNKEKGYPLSLMSIEKNNKLSHINHRCDIICHDKNGKKLMLIECKSHNIKINESVFEQVLNYQKKVQAMYMLVTNGEKHFCFRITKDKPVFLENIPSYRDLIN